MQPAKITKITKLGSSPCLDITVDNSHHLFYANGIVTSNSHAASYAHLTYLTAYFKQHAPARFFRSYLSHAKDKQKSMDELAKMAFNAREHNIDILCPDIRLQNTDFLIKDDFIYFGIGAIKDVGESGCKQILEKTKDIDFDNISWIKFLVEVLLKVKKTSVKRMIAVGCFDHFGLSRKQMLTDHDSVLKLSLTEMNWIYKNVDLSVFNWLYELYEFIIDVYEKNPKSKSIATKNRYNIVKGLLHIAKNPASCLNDTIEEVSSWEKSYLGVSISCHKVDGFSKEYAIYNCGEFDAIPEGRSVCIVGEVLNVVEHLTKEKREEMAFVSASDEFGRIESFVIFPKVWAKHKGLVNLGNVLSFSGVKKEDSFLVNSCKPAKPKEEVLL